MARCWSRATRGIVGGLVGAGAGALGAWLVRRAVRGDMKALVHDAATAQGLQGPPRRGSPAFLAGDVPTANLDTTQKVDAAALAVATALDAKGNKLIEIGLPALGIGLVTGLAAALPRGCGR